MASAPAPTDPEYASRIEKTAEFVARNGQQFEEITRQVKDILLPVTLVFPTHDHPSPSRNKPETKILHFWSSLTRPAGALITGMCSTAWPTGAGLSTR